MSEITTTINESQLRGLIVQQCNGHGTKKAMAERLRIAPSYLSDVISGKRRISAKIADALGYRLITKPLPPDRIFAPKD